MSELHIKQVILHILDSDVGMPVLSEDELESSLELHEFFQSHIERIAGGDDTKRCLFREGSEVQSWLPSLLQEDGFIAATQQMAGRLYEIMSGNPDIPAADAAFVLYEAEQSPHLAILKMNYKASYTHVTQSGGQGNRNALIRHKTILPTGSQKLQEAALINLESREICLLEKKYEVNGQRENYFSERFLECGGSLSRKARLAIVTKAVEKVQQDFLSESEQFAESMKAKSVLYEELAEKGAIDIPRAAEKIFPENLKMREDFIEKVDKYNLCQEPIVPLSTGTTRKFDKQFITTENGIEIRIPMEQYQHPGCVEFITNEDGAVSVIIHNVGRLTSR